MSQILPCETVNFIHMTWTYNQPPISVDTRNLKRISATNWLITDDHGEWTNFDLGCGETELIECSYQEWLKDSIRPMG